MTFRSAAELAQSPELMRPPEVVAEPCAVAGHTTLLTIGPKGGKTTTASGIIARASRAGTRCGLIQLDEAPSTSLQRLLRFGADPERAFLATTFDPATLADEVATVGLEVVVLDHLGKLAEQHADFGANSQGDPVLWGRLVAPFCGLARDLNVAVLLLDQARRSDGKWSGSVGKGGNVDLICELEPKDGGLTCTPKGRARLSPFRVDLDADGLPVFSDSEEGAPAPARLNLVTEPHRLAVLAALQSAEPDGLTTTGWQQLVKERTGLGRSTFFEIRRQLFQGGLVTYASRLYRVARNGARHLDDLEVEATP